MRYGKQVVVNARNILYRPLSSCFDTSILQTASSEFVISNMQEGYIRWRYKYGPYDIKRWP